MLAGLAALLFAYLALIPGGLLLATLDSACAGGECETSLGRDILTGVPYALALAALAATAVALALYAARPTVAGERAIRRLLVASLAALALAGGVLLALAEPLAAAATALAGGLTYGLLARSARRRAAAEGDGHPGNGHVPPELLARERD